jgi:hypothetical protein
MVSNETVELNGTLYVTGATLDLDNVTLLVHTTSDWDVQGIEVWGDGGLTAHDSAITSADPAHRFYFYNWGTLSIERCDVSKMSTWGILTYSGNIVIRNNQIHNGSYGGISAFFSSSQPPTYLENNTLFDIDYFALYLQYYSYFGAGAGPHNLEGDFIVRGNNVSDNIGGGIYAYRYFYDYLNEASSLRANLTIQDNTFLRNRGAALEVYNDIWNGQGTSTADVSFLGRVVVTGNRFEQNAAWQAVYLRNAVTASFSGSAKVDLELVFSNNRVADNSGAGVYIDYLNGADHSNLADVTNDGSMTFSNNTILRNQGYGLRIYRYAGAWLARNASINGTISIVNNTIANNADAGIYLWNYAYSTDAYSALIDGPVRIENNTIVYNSGFGIYTDNYAQKYQGNQNGTAEIRGSLLVSGNEVAFNLGGTAVSVSRAATSLTGSTAYLGGDINVSKNRVYNNSGNGIGVTFNANKNLGKASGFSVIESNLTLEGNWVANNSLYIGVSIDRVATTYYSSASRVTGFTRIRSNIIEGHDSNGLLLQQRTLNFYGSSGAESSQQGDVLFENNTIRANNQAAAYLYYYSYSYYSTSSRVQANFTVLNNSVTDNQNTGLWGYFFASADTALSGDTQLRSTVVVRGNDFSRNKGNGFLLYRQATSARTTGNDAALIGDVTLDSNRAVGNINEGLFIADYVSNVQGGEGARARMVGDYLVVNNTLNANYGYLGGVGIDSYIYAYETETVVRDADLTFLRNTVRDNSGFGAYLSLAGYQYFFKSAAERGIFLDTGEIRVENNTVDANSRMGLFVNLDLAAENAVTRANPRIVGNSFSANLGANALQLRLLDLQGSLLVANNEISQNQLEGVVSVVTGGTGAGLNFENNSMRRNVASQFGVRADFGGAAYNLTIANNDVVSNDVVGGPFFDLANNGRTVVLRNTVRGAINQTAAFNLSAPSSGATFRASNNTVEGNAGKAIAVMTEGLAVIEWNTASNNSRDGLVALTGGDYLSSLARISIHDNTADGNGGNGIWAFATNRLTIVDNLARSNGLAGIRVNYLASAPVIQRNDLTGNRFGLLLSGNGTSPLTASYPLSNLTIQGSLSAGLYVDDVAVALYNSSITSPLGVDLSVRQGRIDAYGTTVGYGKGEVRGSGEIHVWWNLSFKVFWQSGVPVPSAVIFMNGSTGMAYGQKTSNATGQVAPFLAEEWGMVNANRYLWSPYTFTAIKNAEEGANTTALDRDKEVWIIISDRHPPVLVLDRPLEGSIFNRSYVPYAGNATDVGSGLLRLEVALDGALPLTVGVRGDGAFTGAFTLSDGVHHALFRAVDVAGVESAVSVNFTVDTTPPVLVILRPTWGLTNISLVEVVVQTSPDVAAASIGLESLSLRPNATFDAIVRLFEGPNLFRIRATDLAGNSNETFLAITLDTLPPSLSINTPEDGFLTNNPVLSVRGVAEPTARVWVNGVEVEVGTGGLFEAAAQLAEGNNTVEVAAQDLAGNWAYRALRGVLDRVPPWLILTSPPDGTITREDFISVEGEAEEGAVVYVNGKGVLAIGSFRESVHLDEGFNNITVLARDGAGNEARVQRGVTKDTTVPFIDILDPAGGHGFTRQPAYAIRGLTEAFATVTGGGARAVADSAGAFELNVNLSQEENIIRIEAVDLINNRNSTAVTITLDTTPPDLVIFSPPSGTRFQVSSAEIVGATEFGALLTVNGVEVQVAVDGGFRWVVTLRQGVNNVTIRALDKAGNSAEVVLLLTLGGDGSGGTPPGPGGGSRAGVTAGGGEGDAFFILLVLAAGGAAAILVRSRMRRPPGEDAL